MVLTTGNCLQQYRGRYKQSRSNGPPIFPKTKSAMLTNLPHSRLDLRPPRDFQSWGGVIHTFYASRSHTVNNFACTTKFLMTLGALMIVDVRNGYKFVNVLAARNSQIPKQIFDDVRIAARVWECLTAGGRGEGTEISSYKVGCQFYFRSAQLLEDTLE